ncbi:hypothetical protein H310_05158 [Aphanomyces invadans]|uniref:Uncharacterized protein n=1 Tax=Aphanomyces invadans TaxID=157072 RepID=A0A024UD32_9STRA|nr:hypothetical protein H310_05158 [Aphanomyces invadans]ETW03792.1 hypothetical protein H310_05158 [Aphanomyces invadans]|eukprot:XP_008868021.1 hypothetical protein H310_05158 [Aphanomyces invadans]
MDEVQFVDDSGEAFGMGGVGEATFDYVCDATNDVNVVDEADEAGIPARVLEANAYLAELGGLMLSFWAVDDAGSRPRATAHIVAPSPPAEVQRPAEEDDQEEGRVTTFKFADVKGRVHVPIVGMFEFELIGEGRFVEEDKIADRKGRQIGTTTAVALHRLPLLSERNSVKSWPVDDSLDFVGISPTTTNADEVAKDKDFIDPKQTFGEVGVQAIFTKDGEDRTKMTTIDQVAQWIFLGDPHQEVSVRRGARHSRLK